MNLPNKLTMARILAVPVFIVLYMMGQPSCLKSVTGAERDNIGGMLFKI